MLAQILKQIALYAPLVWQVGKAFWKIYRDYKSMKKAKEVSVRYYRQKKAIKKKTSGPTHPEG